MWIKKHLFYWFIFNFILIGYSTYNFCPEATGCFLNTEETVLQCNGILDVNIQNLTHVKAVTLCNYKNYSLLLNNFLVQASHVEILKVFNSNITYIKGPHQANDIKNITITNTNVVKLDKNFLLFLGKLEYLDLRHNHLQDVFLPHHAGSNLSHVYLSDNSWNCSLNLDWILQLNRTVVRDIHHLKCSKKMYSVLYYAKFLQDAQVNCPRHCECTMPIILRSFHSAAITLTPKVVVNCTDRNLEFLPSYLPKYTQILHAERNHISDLAPLVGNSAYKSVVKLYLDHNLIESVDDLEGSSWLSRFQVLSLNGNHITQLPTYAFTHALRQNPNMPLAVQISLGGNPWRCDCVFIPGFQEMLMEYQDQIRDANEIKCCYVQGDENSMSPIMGLSRASVCRLPTEYSIQALDLLNIVLASLIILVLGKLAYDYYYFKRTGRLPWIVTKMP